MKRLMPWFVVLLFNAASVSAAEISAVLAHPIFRQFYSCTEHWADQFKILGDALGTDCAIQELVEVRGRVWVRAYRGSGRQNEDWYGWNKDVLSPCTCKVVEVRENSVVNLPGILGKPPASSITLKRDDGVHFVLAHVANVRVKVGESVESGQAVAAVGNNGFSRQPHIHIAAWKEQEPLQIRFDQVSMGKLLEE